MIADVRSIGVLDLASDDEQAIHHKLLSKDMSDSRGSSPVSNPGEDDILCFKAQDEGGAFPNVQRYLQISQTLSSSSSPVLVQPPQSSLSPNSTTATPDTVVQDAQSVAVDSVSVAPPKPAGGEGA